MRHPEVNLVLSVVINCRHVHHLQLQVLLRSFLSPANLLANILASNDQFHTFPLDDSILTTIPENLSTTILVTNRIGHDHLERFPFPRHGTKIICAKIIIANSGTKLDTIIDIERASLVCVLHQNQGILICILTMVEFVPCGYTWSCD